MVAEISKLECKMNDNMRIFSNGPRKKTKGPVSLEQYPNFASYLLLIGWGCTVNRLVARNSLPVEKTGMRVITPLPTP